MTEVKLTAETLRLYALFEKVTGTRLRDLVEEEDRDVFLVDEANLGKAIGKGAQNLKRLREHLDKDVEVVGYHDDRERFIRNLFHRFKVDQVKFEPREGKGDLARITVGEKDKGRAIGRGGRNVSLARTLAERHHDVSDVIVE